MIILCCVLVYSKDISLSHIMLRKHIVPQQKKQKKNMIGND